MPQADPLSSFHPLVRQWFTSRFTSPTPVQSAAWPAIDRGEHVLVTAPTGSGKTLAAFLCALDAFARGTLEPGRVRVLYVSPLRALNNDIRRNLVDPLAGIAAGFAAAGRVFPDIRPATRSGDTPPAERRAMLRHPPEVLITTPESLNVLLTSRSGADLLAHVAIVILDEVHAVAGTKRGTHLVTAVERLARLAGEFQRIVLSATVRPLDRVAAWVGGFRPSRTGGEPQPRPVTVLDPGGRKSYDVRVRAVGPQSPVAGGPNVWDAIADAVATRIKRNRSTLVFANSKRTVEKLARLLQFQPDAPRVFSHHGALSRELREVVEARLKAGELDGIVATNSLELGIDIGAIDEVALVGTPPSVSSAVQRLGRAGHQVGAVSRGVLYPVHPRDLLDAAVVVRAALDGDVEPLAPVVAPLDVLAQVVLSMTATESWRADALFDFLRVTSPYHDLSRRRFDLVVEMLAGRFESTRLPALRARLAVDHVDGTLRARPGVARELYASGGTIADRGTFALRHAESGAKLGELDEEFVWERTIGDAFLLGVQSWSVQRVTNSDVFVLPGRAGTAMAPFWRAEPRDRTWWLAERTGVFLEHAEARLAEPGFAVELSERHGFDDDAAGRLVDWLRAQRDATRTALPHRHHVVGERVAAGDESARNLLLLHAPWGGRVLRPLAVALAAAFRERHGASLRAIHDDMCLAVETPFPCTTDELLALVPAADVERLLAADLADTGFFGAAFREAAGRALLLPRRGFGRRTPLWLSRQRAKDLLDAVSRFDDFPIVLEAWRTCLQDAMDVPALRDRLAELAAGAIRVSEARTARASPFADGVVWKRTNELMYEDDVPAPRGGPRLSGDLVREAALSPRLRPRVSLAIADVLRRKLQRTFLGYAPPDAAELCEWVKERVLVPADEWRELLEAIRRDHGLGSDELFAAVGSRVVGVRRGGEGGERGEEDSRAETQRRREGKATELIGACSVEAIPRLRAVLDVDEELLSARLDGSRASVEAVAAVAAMEARPVEAAGEEDPATVFLAEWLRFEGPVAVERLPERIGMRRETCLRALDALAEDERVVVDELTRDAPGPEVCDVDNLSRLLRLARTEARPAFEPLPADALPLVLATAHGLTADRHGPDALRETMERLFGFPAAASAWESEILPARVEGYRGGWLDALLAETALIWFGGGEEQLAFAPEEDRALFAPEPGAADPSAAGPEDALPDGPGRFSLEDLMARTGRSSAELTKRLWKLAWEGLATNDSFHAVRRGLATGFVPSELLADRSARSQRGRWRTSRAFPGAWRRLPPLETDGDALEEEETNRERVRVLLDRHGLLFRELLARELPALRWGALFRTMRLMELSGEVAAGVFVRGAPGLQFAAPAFLARLLDGMPEDRTWWINAADPASPCGLGLVGLDLPRRLPTTHLAFRGRRLVVVSEGRGRKLRIGVPPDDPRLPEHLAFLSTLLSREAQPLRAVDVDEINGEPAADSPYRPVLEATFHTDAGPASVRLSRRR
ncbi:MAG: DEAD/DEAH box helicase [Deltaproteobacteria bacterium]|nr:DEAD/DEAH box helicase [Deltaproteobacteria bacterium]